MLTIDGGQGEGGGQILRTALSELAFDIGKVFEVAFIELFSRGGDAYRHIP